MIESAGINLFYLNLRQSSNTHRTHYFIVDKDGVIWYAIKNNEYTYFRKKKISLKYNQDSE